MNKQIIKDRNVETYTELFHKAMKAWKPDEGETITQCVDDYLGERYFCPAWATSNLGKSFFITENGTFEPLNTSHAGLQGQQIQVLNCWHEDVDYHVMHQRLIAVYHCDRSILEKDKEHPILPTMSQAERADIFRKHWHVHHIQKRNFDNKSIAENDRADNLQFITADLHDKWVTPVERTGTPTVLKNIPEEKRFFTDMTGMIIAIKKKDTQTVVFECAKLPTVQGLTTNELKNIVYDLVQINHISLKEAVEQVGGRYIGTGSDLLELDNLISIAENSKNRNRK